jgi:hypothetical protein
MSGYKKFGFLLFSKSSFLDVTKTWNSGNMPKKGNFGLFSPEDPVFGNSDKS